MGLFGRKGERKDYDDDFDDELEEEKREARSEIKFRRKLRDLNPGNKRKRKEPPKPWGKKERFIVFGVMAGTILVSGFLSLSARNFKLPGLPKLSPDFDKFNISDLNPFGEKVIRLGNSNILPQKNEVIESFKNETNALSGTYSLYVIDISSGHSFGVGENEMHLAASLIKLPVLGVLYKEVENGQVSLDEKYTLKNSDKVGGSGSLSGKPVGTVLTLRDLARLMGQESDNTSFGILRRRLGDEKISAFMHDIGMDATNLDTNMTTASDIGAFYSALWNKKFTNERSRDEILGFLTKTIYEDHLPKGIPADTKISHKYGREVHVINDAGIVFAPNPYIVVIVTEGVVEKEADAVFPLLSKLVYDGMTK